MKRTISLIICFIIAFGSIAIGINSLTAGAYSSWQEAYADKLKSELGKYNNGTAFFSLIYLNGDSTPELLVTTKTSVPSLYTYSNGGVVSLGNYGFYDGRVRYLEKQGYILWDTSNHGIDELIEYKMVGTSITTEITLSDSQGTNGDYGPIFYRINDVDVPQEQYEAKRNEIWNKNWKVSGFSYVLNQANINKTLNVTESTNNSTSESGVSSTSVAGMNSTQQKKLEKFLESWYGVSLGNESYLNYDYNKISNPSIMSMLLSYCSYASFYPGKADYTDVQYDSTADPRKVYDKLTYGSGYSYIKSNADQVDWVMKNIFNCTDDDIKSMLSKGESYLSSNNNDFVFSFYKSGNYYYSYTAGIGGNTDWYAKINSIKEENNKFLVNYSINTFQEDDPTRAIQKTYSAYALLEYKTINGGNYWSLYKNAMTKFDFIDVSKEPDKYTIEYLDGTSDTFDHDLDYYINKADSCKYDPDLAYMLMSIANAAYDKSKVDKMYKTLGFDNKFISDDYDLPLIYDTKVRYSLGTKTMDNGKTLVLIDIAGTSGDFGDFTAMEWWSDVDLGLTTAIASGYHRGFEQAADYLLKGLNTFISENKIKKNEAIFVVTGHSRGGAVGNIVSNKLGVKKSNLYNYNFACPDVAVNTPVYWNTYGTNDNIFNISCNQDLISMVPGELGDLAVIIKTNQWGKYGKSLWFCHDWSDVKYDNIFLPSHDPAYYLAYFRQKKPESELKDYFAMKTNIPNPLSVFNLFEFLCPVDVTLTDDSGKVIAQVTDDKVTKKSDDVFVIVSQGHKIIQVFNDKHVNVSLEGTDKGNMTVIMKEYKSPSLEVTQNVSFEDIELSKGTQIKTEWGGDIKPESVNLIDGITGEIISAEKSTEITDNDASVETTPGKINKITIIIIVAAVVVALIIAAIIFIILRNKKKQTQLNEAEGANVIPQETTQAQVTAPLPIEEKLAPTPAAPQIEYSCKEMGFGGRCGLCKNETETLYLVTARKDGKEQKATVCRSCAERVIAKFKKQNSTNSK